MFYNVLKKNDSITMNIIQVITQVYFYNSPRTKTNISAQTSGILVII